MWVKNLLVAKELFHTVAILAVLSSAKASDLVMCSESGQSFHPHPTNCSLFIECNGGLSTVLSRIEGRHFDSEVGYCNFPKQADCQVETTTEENDSILCSDSEQSFHHYPTNCSLFIECNKGISTVLSCIEGLYFDSDRGYCNFPEEANCDVEESLITCPERGQFFYPHPRNCSLFIECNNGIPVVLACIEGLEFDSDRGYCNFPEEANCEVEISTEENDNNLVTCPESGQSFHPHPTNCSLFIECHDGQLVILACIEGLQFDPDRGYCNFPEEANCEAETSIQKHRSRHKNKSCPPTGQHFFPHPYNCSQFIECRESVYAVVDCINGLHFDANIGWCDFPENVGCVDSTPAPSTTAEPNPDGGPVGQCAPLNGQYVQFLTDSKDCTIFYMCNWGTPIKMHCPSGLHFNPSLNVCDWPWNAGCTLGQ